MFWWFKKSKDIDKLIDEIRFLKVENMVLKERSRMIQEENKELKSKLTQYLVSAKLEEKEMEG